mgnify:CR=1 FL=1
MASIRHHTTQTHPAYEPPHDGVRRRWQLVVAALVVVALLALTVRPVCVPDGEGRVDEAGFGVRHERRGTTWYHCEPWIRHVTSD